MNNKHLVSIFLVSCTLVKARHNRKYEITCYFSFFLSLSLETRVLRSIEKKNIFEFYVWLKSKKPRRHAREENPDLSANCERNLTRTRVLSQNFLLFTTSRKRRRRRRVREKTQSCISRRKYGSAAAGGTYSTTGALMHIGIVANALERKKKMNRKERCRWLAVRCRACWIVVRGRINQSRAGAICRARRL